MVEAMAPLRPTLPPQIKKFTEKRLGKKGFIFGDQGAGKTTLAATAPGPILWLNCEDGWDVLTQEQKERDSCWDCRTWDDVEQATTWLEQGGAKMFPTVVIDTVTEAGKLKKKALLSKPRVGGPGRVHPLTLGEAEYDFFAEEMLAWLRRFRPLECNVIFTGQPRDIEVDEPDGDQWRHTSLRYVNIGEGRKGSREAPGLFDFVAYLETGEVKDGKLQRRLLIQPVGSIKAKIRTPGDSPAPLGVINPNMTALINLMNTGKYALEV